MGPRRPAAGGLIVAPSGSFVKPNRVWAEFDHVAISQSDGARQQLMIDGRPRSRVEVLDRETTVLLTRDANVLRRDFGIHRADKGKG